MDIHYNVKSAKAEIPWLSEKLRELRSLLPVGVNRFPMLPNTASDNDFIAINEIMKAISEKQIVLRDPVEGLVDFPAIVNSMPAYLCWAEKEDELSYWHYADEGFARRKLLTEAMDILEPL